jgi:hypothetical protein
MQMEAKELAMRFPFRQAESLKEILRHLLDVLFPDPRKKYCPHCGGGQCLKLCMILGDPSHSSSFWEEPGEEE